ncbi:hypothetical protein GCM10010172_33170 [Paractinoplanes ferrugineus]|uniref:Uncharacterized protein n=1 Tax=Paractinoplanes ferrugineus TaxID=113564 RepID=A0A919J7H9_9ACTN|nr:hypothetical protein Afe05nite_65920 [Actinoplanes ferrugineus]
MTLDEGFAADRLLRLDVVLDDRPQHLELAVIQAQDDPSLRHSAGKHPARTPAELVWHSSQQSASLRRGGPQRDDRVCLSIPRLRVHVALYPVELRSYGVSHD